MPPDLTKKTPEWTLTKAAKAAIPEWNRKWERIILSTDEIDFDRTASAVRCMYAAAKLAEPVIVRCLSPMQGTIVCAWAAAFWYVVGKAGSATRSAIYSATDSATRSATRSATDASLKSVPQTMWEAARSVVRSKLNDAAFRQAEAIAKNNLPRWWDFYNGGSEWASWCAFLSFPRDICGWKSPTHANYAHYENAAIHGGGRFMHTHFCLLCDRPITRKTRLVSAVHQLHCEDGPSIEWRCGTRAWHLGGVAATEKVVMRPHELTPADIHSVQDEELRSAMLERYPWPRYLGDVGATCIDEGPNEIEGTYEALFDAPQVGQRRMVATCATGHIVSLGVPSTVSTLGEARRYLSPFGNKTRIVART